MKITNKQFEAKANKAIGVYAKKLEFKETNNFILVCCNACTIIYN